MIKPGALPLFWSTNQDFNLPLQFGVTRKGLDGNEDDFIPMNITGYTLEMVIYNGDDPSTVYLRLLSTGGSPAITVLDAIHGKIKISYLKASVLSAYGTFQKANYQLYLLPPSGNPPPWLESTLTVSLGPTL